MQSEGYLSVESEVWHCVNQVGGKMSHPMTQQIQKDLHPTGQF